MDKNKTTKPATNAVSSIRWFCKHEWTKWVDFKEGREDGWPVLLQERRCVHCNKAKRRVVNSKW